LCSAQRFSPGNRTRKISGHYQIIWASNNVASRARDCTYFFICAWTH